MKKYYYLTSTFFLFLIFFIACSDNTDNYIPISPVSVDLTLVPYQKLSDYHFFKGPLKDQNPSLNVLPYEPASSLFTDYALKKRFVWMPNGQKATYNGDGNVLIMPVGAALIKTFYYNNVQPSNTAKIIESRIMIRKSDGWIFANYIWNDDQTEAYLDVTGNGAIQAISWKDENNVIKGVNYQIPSNTQCFTCHKHSEEKIPIGIKPQNLNFNLTYGTSSRNQLQKWIDMGYLEDNLPNNIVSTVNYKDATKSLSLRVRSYVDINCAHCHQNDSHCDYRPMRFAFNETMISSNLGICVDTEDMNDFPTSLVKIVNPGNITKSMMYYRLNTEDESFRMPLLGRTIKHEEGIQLINDWINSLNNCN